MKKDKSIIIGLILFLIAVCLICVSIIVQSVESEEKDSNIPVDKKPQYILSADAWFSECCEGTSQEKYLNQWVKVQGTVLWISETNSRIGYALAGGKESSLICWIDGHDVDAQFGQYIEYVGRVTEADSNTITLSDGYIEVAKWPDPVPKSPVTISDWSATRDSAGGVEWNFRFTNNTDKVIKYIYISWDCYNAVGDLVYDQITGKSNVSLKYTGPLGPGEKTDLLENTTRFYSYSFNSSALTKLQVEFMDGTLIWVSNEGHKDFIVD